MIQTLAFALLTPATAPQWPTSPTFTSRSGQLHNPVPSSDWNRDWMVPDGPVKHLIGEGKALYLSGDFRNVGYPTSRFAVFDRASGLPDRNWPQFEGEVRDIEPDGVGGWYVAGRFTHVNGIARPKLVHVLPDGSVDPVFQFSSAGDVDAIALDGGQLLLAGGFLDIGGVSRRYLAEVDAATGALGPWNPTFGALNWIGTPRMHDLVVDGNSVYVAGSFDGFFAATPRQNFASLDRTTGGLLPALDLAPDGLVSSVQVIGSELVLTGGFQQLGGAQRARLAVVHAPTGVVQSLSLQIDRVVWDSVLVGTTLYFCGDMTDVEGQLRNGGAAIDLPSGTLTAWNPDVGTGIGSGGAIQVQAIGHGAGTIYLAGNFLSIGGVARTNFGAVDDAVGSVLPWPGGVASRNTNTPPQSVAVQGQSIAVGGSFVVAGGGHRTGVAALDVDTGLLLPWSPELSSGLGQFAGHRLLPVPGGVLIAAPFDTVNGVSRRNLALVDDVLGSLVTSFVPTPAVFDTPNMSALSLLESQGRVLVGVNVSSSNPKSGIGLVMLDLGTGAEVPGWQGAVQHRPYELAIDEGAGTLYVGGEFTTAGLAQLPRNNVAAFDWQTGTLLPWDPNTDGAVHSFAFRGSRLLMGGAFSAVGFEFATGVAELVLPGAKKTAVHLPRTVAYDLAEHGLLTYVAGPFTQVGLLQREGVFAFDRISGKVYPWGPNLDGGAESVVVAGGHVVVGGAFDAIGTEAHAFLAAFPIL